MPPRSLRTLTLSAPKTTTSPGPPSPTFSEATNVSGMNFGDSGPEKIITRANLKASLHAYEELMNCSANYRAALMTMSKVTAAFADAMETCSGLKGPSYEAGTRLQAASGLHHLIGNHWHVLAETLDKNFEKPLRQHLETYRTIVNERSASYERALYERSQIIRQTEIGNMHKRQRNLQSFREALTVLQRQVDELDGMKGQHYQEIMEHEEEVWDVVQAKVCVAVRSTMDVFDRFTAKASDPVIEPMLQAVPDPFDSYGPQQSEDQIFSILQPLSISANAPSPSPSPMTASPPDTAKPEHDLMSRNSWLPSTTNVFSNSEPASEWAEVPSSPNVTPTSSSTPPRSVSPPASKRKSAGHQARKSASKLRSSLPGVEEISGSHDGTGEPAYSEAKAGSAINGNKGDTSAGNNTWGAFSYGKSPYEPYTESAESTLRRSTLYSPQHALPNFDPDPISKSPQSDDTAAAHVPLTS
ncbi:hypothetical protein FIBSPDRAFT_735433 [Athelia psychrophila]|uniref:IMD domain-containing protein n=1 Tax=Athelia psychrophila TaxID=1759441 RepID=A0A166N5X5_9AGAM|nr:hypothetical protein FIBSPDRAFT_735433 [Fibularhizoctonia sp. CBS 109695]